MKIFILALSLLSSTVFSTNYLSKAYYAVADPITRTETNDKLKRSQKLFSEVEWYKEVFNSSSQFRNMKLQEILKKIENLLYYKKARFIHTKTVSEKHGLGANALHLAATINDNSEVLKRLLDYARPEYVNSPDSNGRTPIFYAIKCEEGMNSNVQHLQAGGANLSHMDNFSKTALDYLKEKINAYEDKVPQSLQELLHTLEKGTVRTF